jgi:hypothetical protein
MGLCNYGMPINQCNLFPRNKSWEKEDPDSGEAPPVKREPRRDAAHHTSWRREGGQRRRDGETNNYYRYPHEEQAMFGRGGPHHFAAAGSPHHHHPYAGYHQYGAPMGGRHYADYAQDGGGYRYSSNHQSFGHQGHRPHDGGADGWHGRRSGGWRGSSSRWHRGT